jgi:L-asparaginase II
MANYSWLRPEHFALMMASHSCEQAHLTLLEEIEALGGISRDRLGCPATYPISHEMKVQLKGRGAEPQSIYHNCSGKHFGYLLALKAQGKEQINYLDRQAEHFHPLKSILSSITGRAEDSFDVTTDGCQLPNYALTPLEMASMYLALVCGHSTAQPRTAKLAYLSQLMREYPKIVSGSERLDGRLMSGRLTDPGVPVIAKEGADGLIGIGIGACGQYKNGLGILIKLASGTDSRHTEAITRELLRQLGLLQEKPAASAVGPAVRTDHLKTNFHFQLALAGTVNE